jgi:hypothetical protein
LFIQAVRSFIGATRSHLKRVETAGGLMIARALLVAAALFASNATGTEDVPASLRELLMQFRCPIADRLERIYAVGDPETHRDEYLIVSFPDRPENYVQCLFYQADKIMCEAASGFYLDPPEKPRTAWLPADAVAALGRLGFSTDDSAGNFRIDLDLADPPDFRVIADLILKALHDGYGARADMNLLFNAPYAPDATTKCDPTS